MDSSDYDKYCLLIFEEGGRWWYMRGDQKLPEPATKVFHTGPNRAVLAFGNEIIAGIGQLKEERP